MLFEAWNCFIHNEISDKIFRLKNQYILLIETNFSCERGVKLTEETDMKALIDLLCLAGALRSNKKSLKELWGTDGDDNETFRLVTNQRRFKLQIIYILNKLEFFT